MKQNRKEQETLRKSRNQGFSLVELIVVIAIMAVLVAVLAPQFTRYVDRSRKSVDATMISGIVTAAQVGIADVTEYNIQPGEYTITSKKAGGTEVTATNLTVTNPGDSVPTANPDKMTKAIADACGTMTELKPTANAWDEIVVKIKIEADNQVKVTYETAEFKKYIEGKDADAGTTENQGNGG